jgi:RNA polymerase sigma-70 factor, ECF subfamily
VNLRGRGTSGAPAHVVTGVATRAEPLPAFRERPLTRRAKVREAALVRAAQRGSEEAVAELFARHWEDARRAALLVTGDRAAAEDIAQEAFLAALRALPRFDLRRPLRPWLHRIVVNRAIDFARARALRAEVGADAAGDPPAAPEPAGPPLDEDIATALLGLSVDQRAVVVLRYLLDFTPGEIAALLDLPRGTVNSRLRRGLDELSETVR